MRKVIIESVTDCWQKERGGGGGSVFFLSQCYCSLTNSFKCSQLFFMPNLFPAGFTFQKFKRERKKEEKPDNPQLTMVVSS